MLKQQHPGNLARLKYLLAVPICAALLCAPALAFSKTYGCIPAKSLPKPQEQKPDTLPRNAYMVRFIGDLGLNTKYPAEAIKNKFEGHVIATFMVAANKLKDIKVITTGKEYGIPEEITRALQNCLQPVNIQPGKYAVPFYFSLSGSYHNHTVDKDDKTSVFNSIANGFTLLKEVVIAYP